MEEKVGTDKRSLPEMNTIPRGLCCLLMICGFVWSPGCARRVPVSLPQNREIPAPAIARTGYTVQVGAFSIQDNALRLTRSLNGMGLGAYCYLDVSGLTKVRFGDFSSWDAARAAARGLIGRGLIEDYIIVVPGDYAVSKLGILGEDYLRDSLGRAAESFLGVEYSWGGSSREEGLDCSGLTMAVYQMNGINLPHSSKEQFRAGRSVSADNIKKGDIVFFGIKQPREVSHVGIYLEKGIFIHAPGTDEKIRKDSLTNGYFRDRFVGARTYLNDSRLRTPAPRFPDRP